MPKCINKETNQIVEYKKIEDSLTREEIGNYCVNADFGTSRADAVLTPIEFYKLFKPLNEKLTTEIEQLETSISEDKKASKQPKQEGRLYRHVKRMIYYCAWFYDDVIPYREGTLELETYGLRGGQEIWPDCKFVSIQLDSNLKDMVCEKYGKSRQKLKQLEITKIEIIEKG